MIFEREFDILLPVLSVLSGARLTLWFAYLFQLKEYRIDRFRDFVRSDDGFRFLFGLPVFGRLVIYGVVGVFCLAVFGALESRVAVTFLFLVELLIAFRKFWRKSFYRPVFTGKALFLLFISLFAEVILGLLISYEPAWVIAWGARFFFMALIFFGSFYPTLLVKKYYILRAKKVMDSYPDLRRIAVTGSYGKTTIKEFLVKTLSQKYKTVAPSKNFNTEIGVAKFILSTDWSGVEIFVVEMGAYQIGDIRVLSEMVSPEVGILTVINEEHLSLFGSLKNTQTAKYELLRALPEHGLAIVNSDNALCREYLYELSCQIETFGYDNEYAPTFLLKEVKSSSDGISVSAVFESKNFEIKASVLGEHQAMNLAPVYLVAKKFGFSHDDISRAFSNLSAPEHRQQIMNYGQAIVIDDTYNSNPEGFMSALQTLNHLAKGRRRVVITRGMLELGERSDYLHEKVAGEIAFSADELVIIAPNSSDPLVSGLGERNRVLVKKIYEPVEILQYVKSLKDQKVAILFENRLPSIIAKEIFGHL